MSDFLKINLQVDSAAAKASINTFFTEFEQGAARAKHKLNAALGQKVTKEVFLKVEGDEAVAQLRQADTVVQRIAKATAALNGKFGRTPNEIKKSVRALESLRGNTEKYDRATGKVSRAWKKVNDQLDKATEEMKKFNREANKSGGGGAKNVKSMGNAFTAAGVKANIYFAIISAGTEGVKAAIDGMVTRAREINALNISLRSFMETQESVNALMEVAQQTAVMYGVSISSVEKAWRRVGPAANAAGLSLKETNDVITAATARMAMMGLNAEQSGRYMEALAQVMGKGKLQGEELRQQFSELDGAMRAQIAQALDALYGIKNLDEAMQKSQVSAEMFAKALVYSSGQAMEDLKNSLGGVEEMFENMNLEQRINHMNNMFTLAGEKWGELFGPLGNSLVKIGAMIGSYLATWTTRFPETARLIQDAFSKAGEFLEILFKGFIFSLELFSRWVEKSAGEVESFTAIILKMMPLMSEIDEIFKFFGFKPATAQIAEKIDKAMEGIRDNTVPLADDLTDISTLWKDIEEQLNKAQEGAKGITPPIDDSKEKAAQLKAEMDGIDDKTKALSRAWRDFKTNIQAAKKDITDQKKESERMYQAQLKGIDRVREGQKRSNEDAKALIAAQKDRTEAMYDAKVTNLENAHDAAMAAIDKEIQAVEAQKDAEAEKFDKKRAKLEENNSRAEQHHAAELKRIDEAKKAALAALDQRKKALESANQSRKAAYAEERTSIDNQKAALADSLSASKDAAQASYDSARSAMESRYDSEFARIDSAKEKVSGAIEAEKRGLDQIKEQVNSRYDAEMSRLDQRMSKIQSSYDSEIAALNQLTPAEKALKAIQIDKLKQTARNGELSQEERLRAQAQLDDMRRQQAIKKAEARLRAQEAAHETAMTALEQSKTNALERAAKTSESRVVALQAQNQVLDQQKQVLERNQQIESAALEAGYNKFVQQLEKRKEAEEKRLEEKKARVDEQEAASDAAHEAALSRLEAQKTATSGNFDSQKEQMDATEEKRSQNHEAELEDLEAAKEKSAEKFDAAQEALEASKEEEGAAHEQTISRLEAQKQKATARYDAQSKAIDTLEKQQKRAHADEKTRIGDERTAANQRYDDELSKIDEREEAGEAYYTAEKDRLEDLKAKVSDLADANAAAATSGEAHATATENMATAYNNYASALQNAAAGARAYRQALGSGGGGSSSSRTPTASSSAPGSGTMSARFAGGPVTGGRSYQVNELGQEAFLSNSGKLSMIKAPAFGEWKAPGTGTVIPAHVTSTLGVPTGGIDVSQVAGTQSGGDRSLLNAIKSLAGMGGVTHNNVTIQAANTTQAASDMMVNLNRIKRNRIR